MSARAFLGPEATWIGVANPAEARLVARSSAAAIWVSGYCLSVELRGLPDASFVTASELLDAVRRIGLVAGHKPIVVDLDSGYGDVHLFASVVNELIRTTPAAGVVVEDKLFPKRNSFYRHVDQVLVDPEELGEKLRAAKSVARGAGSDLRVIARTEALIADRGVEEAVERMRLYKHAGADGVFVQSRNEPQELRAALGVWTASVEYAPIVISPTAYPSVSATSWWAAGASVVLHANQLLRTSLQAQAQVLEQLLDPDRPVAELSPQMWTMGEVDALVQAEVLADGEGVVP